MAMHRLHVRAGCDLSGAPELLIFLGLSEEIVRNPCALEKVGRPSFRSLNYLTTQERTSHELLYAPARHAGYSPRVTGALGRHSRAGAARAPGASRPVRRRFAT